MSRISPQTDRASHRRYDETLHRSLARSLLRATDRESVYECAVERAHDVSGIDDIVAYVPDESGDALLPVVRAAGEPADIAPITDQSPPWHAFDAGTVTSRETEATRTVFAPAADRALLAVTGDGTEPVPLPSFGRELADDVAAALDGLDDDGTDPRRVAELQRRNAQLERRDAERQELVRMFAHDLRNPLSAANACIELAAASDDPADQLSDLTAIHERMLDLVDDMMTLTKDDDITDEIRPVSPSEIAADAWTTVGAERGDGDSRLTVDDDRARLRADEERLRTLFENVLCNAVEHGGDDVTVRVGSLDDGFYVADDGVGIPAEDREQVLESGYSTDADGTGLGLAIVRRIADDHGWCVDVTTSRHDGARIEFRGVETAASGTDATTADASRRDEEDHD
jgi:signal transduction histidine kinase